MDWWMAFAAFCAFMLKGMCGFANTLVFSTMMAFRAGNIDITPVDLLLGFAPNLIMVGKERKSLSFKVWGPLAGLLLLGCVPGVLLLKNGDVRAVKIFFGLVVLAAAVNMLVQRRAAARAGGSAPVNRVALVGLGLFSGLLCGMFGIGALLAAYVGRVTKSAAAFRGNISMVFLVENVFRIALYAANGIFTASVLQNALRSAPFMLLGLGCGILLSKKVDDEKIKTLTIVVLAASGISLVAGNIGLLFGG